MPTVWRIGHFRFHFYSREADEPARDYVRNADGECKFWLDPFGWRPTEESHRMM